MASQEQIEANRRNAQLSTGPKTPEGKAVVSHNPTRHGLASSRAIVLPEENREEFQELLKGFESDHQPEGALEQFLVFQLAAAEWRLRRITRLETGLFIDRLDDLRDDLRLRRPTPEPGLSAADQQFDEHTRLLGRVFWRGCSGDAFVKLLRYENSTRRGFYKALNELKLIQTRRAGAPPPENEK
jgi:hypothetical protein